MEPFAQLAPHTLAGVVGVATDLDDTLTAHGPLATASLAALHALAHAGIPCVVATGRPVGWAEVLARVLPVRAVVAENGGAWIVREGRTLRAAFFASDEVLAEGMARVRNTAAEITRMFPAIVPVKDLTARLTDVALDVGEAVTVPRDAIDGALAYARSQGLHAVASTVHLHLSARAPDKLEGLREAVRELGLEPARLATEWLYVGDSPNDAGPFEAMALSVGVAEVSLHRARMPALPKYVTAGGAGAGFGEVVERLLAARAAHRPAP